MPKQRSVKFNSKSTSKMVNRRAKSLKGSSKPHLKDKCKQSADLANLNFSVTSVSNLEYDAQMAPESMNDHLEGDAHALRNLVQSRNFECLATSEGLSLDERYFEMNDESDHVLDAPQQILTHDGLYKDDGVDLIEDTDTLAQTIELWPAWADAPDFQSLIYEPIYLNEIRTVTHDILSVLSEAAFSADIMRDIAPLKVKLVAYNRGRVLVDICRRLDPNDIEWLHAQNRYLRDRRLLNDLLANIHQLIFSKSDLLKALVNEAGKMPLILAHNQMSINQAYVTLEQQEEDELVADIQTISDGYQDYPASIETILDLSHANVFHLNEMLNELVSVRQDLSNEQGFESFVNLGFRRLGYFDVKPDQVIELHRAIEAYVVPVACEIRQAMNKKGYTFKNVFEASRPRYTQLDLNLDAGVHSQLNQVLVDTLGPHAKHFWFTLYSKHYVQIHHRPDQRMRFICNHLMEPNIPILYINRNLNVESLSGYLNMAGRAFGLLCSQMEQSRFFDIEPSVMAMRIWGRMMELSCHHGVQALFKDPEDATIWQMEHLAGLLLELPLLALIHEFQMQLYTMPNVSKEEQNYAWLRLIQRYFPDLSKDQEWLASVQSDWINILSTYTEPFSALSKMVAIVAGLSLWDMARKNQKDAIHQYARMCTSVRENTTLTLLYDAGLPSPLEVSTIKRLVYQVCKHLDI